MKFSKFGRIAVALSATLVLALGVTSCSYNFTAAYIYVTGSYYNQIGGFKEDNNTGSLRPVPGSPFSSGGSNPIRSLILSNGRFMYVLNEGKPTTDSTGNITWSGANISVFSIGGNGTISFQQSYNSAGNGSIRLSVDSSGSHLFVLDSYEPFTNNGATAATSTLPCLSADGFYHPYGDISVFTIDSNTGRLSIVTNQQQTDSAGNPLTYFPLGCNPIDFHATSSYIYTAEVSDPTLPGQKQVVLPYLYTASTGQLTTVSGGAEATGATGISVIGATSSNSYIYVVDAAANSGVGQIITFTQGSNGFLQSITGGTATNPVSNDSTAAAPDAIATDSKTKFLYVANTAASSSLNSPGSEITAFSINATSGDLVPLLGQPFGTGSGPVCIFQDTTHQYLYTADAVSNTVTGHLIDPNTGVLTDLNKGSTYGTVQTPTWCVTTGVTD